MAVIPTIKRTNSGGMGSPMLTYPETLGTMDRHKHYVMFYINQSAKSKINFGAGSYDTSPNPPGSVRPEATTLSIKRAPTQRLSQAIALYMPAKLAVAHTANYGEQEIGAVVAGGASALQTLTSGMSNTAIAKELGSKMVEGGAAQLENMALMALDATIAPGAKAAVEITRGTVLNNRTEMAFEGIGRREFSFEFRMLPNNAKEAETIENIVTTFRYHAMPEIEGSDLTGRTMISPSTFDIEYFPNTHLHKISTSVLQSVSVNYGGDRPQFFDDDHPVETQLSLGFKELEIITKERIAKGF
tara:strand:- start:184 stop:1086 length:903 start_codon:yes stop_codon:yes gene_type:complete